LGFFLGDLTDFLGGLKWGIVFVKISDCRFINEYEPILKSFQFADKRGRIKSHGK